MQNQGISIPQRCMSYNLISPKPKVPQLGDENEMSKSLQPIQILDEKWLVICSCSAAIDALINESTTSSPRPGSTFVSEAPQL